MNRSNYVLATWAVLLFALIMLAFSVTASAQSMPARKLNGFVPLRLQEIDERVARALPQLPPAFTLNAPLVVAGTADAGLRLRKAPSLTSELIDLLPEGSSVVNMGQQAYDMGILWRLVRASNGATGWVASQYLQPVR